MKKFFALIVLTLLTTPAFSQPQRTFVSARNGNDANVCSLSSPCRNLQRGIDTVAAGGEVIPLDSGGYGGFLVNKPLSVSAPSGIHVAVTTTSPGQQYAIAVYGTGNVSLHGLSVSNLGGWGGIYYDGGGQLRVSAATITDALYNGVWMFNAGTLSVTDSVITNSGSDGVSSRGTDATHRGIVSVDNARISGAWVAVSGWQHTDTTVRNSALFNNDVGAQVIAQAAGQITRMTLEGCTLDNNLYGVLSDPYPGDPNWGLMRLSNSVITHSATRAIWLRNGLILSRGNNTVIDNAADEVFSPGGFAAK